MILFIIIQDRVETVDLYQNREILKIIEQTFRMMFLLDIKDKLTSRKKKFKNWLMS